MLYCPLMLAVMFQYNIEYSITKVQHEKKSHTSIVPSEKIKLARIFLEYLFWGYYWH